MYIRDFIAGQVGGPARQWRAYNEEHLSNNVYMDKQTYPGDGHSVAITIICAVEILQQLSGESAILDCRKSPCFFSRDYKAITSDCSMGVVLLVDRMDICFTASRVNGKLKESSRKSIFSRKV